MSDNDKDNPGTVIRRPRPGGQRALDDLLRRQQQGSAEGPSLDRYADDAEDRTVVRGALPTTRVRFEATNEHASSMGLTPAQAENPMFAAAAGLIGLAASLERIQQADRGAEARLRRQASQMIGEFQSQLAERDIPAASVQDAAFCLCAFVDQMVLRSPWARQSQWASDLLRAEYFRDVDVNSRLSGIAEKAAGGSGVDRDLAEFVFILLSLGLETSRVSYAGYRDRLSSNIARDRRDRLLSEHWRGESSPLSAVRVIPAWVVIAATSAMLVFVFLGFRLSLNAAAEPLLSEVGGIGFDRRALPGIAMALAEQPRAEPSLRDLLAAEVASGLVLVSETAGGEIVLLNASSLFASASDVPEARYQPVIEAIGLALAQKTGRVDVIGHSDDVPIRSFRFQSNTELSVARARSIADHVRRSAGSMPVSHVGRGASEPLCREATPACRAMNRRVEIIYHRS